MIGGGPVNQWGLDDLVSWSRRLAANPSWTVAGGGNTSMKGLGRDALGTECRVLWVKGSGVDLSQVTPADFAPLDLDRLQSVGAGERIDDGVAASLVQGAVVQPGARRPSVETLMHAVVPGAFVFHVHADSICAIANHADGGAKVAAALGERFAWLDWIHPGVALARRVADLAGYDGVVLAHHGLVAWDDDPRRCFEKVEWAIAEAARYLGRAGDRVTAGSEPAGLSGDEERRFLLAVRGRLCKRGHRVRAVDGRLREAAGRDDVAAVVRAGVSSADHMLWIGPWSCAISDPRDIESALADIDAYEERYSRYLGPGGEELERLGKLLGERTPRVLLVPGLGAVATGSCEREARLRAEVAFHTHTVAGAAIAAFGAVGALDEATLLEWSQFPPEVAKLKDAPPPGKLSGRVFIVTGAASGIGRTVARELASRGASVVAADRDGELLDLLARELEEKGQVFPVAGDLAGEEAVSEAVSEAIRRYGGLDGAVLNVGTGVTGRLEELGTVEWHRALEVNLTSAFLLTREAMRAMRVQGIGGSLVYVASKNAFGPGAGFGAYSVSKAGMIQLMRIAALEGGEVGIRANAVNPDAVFDNSRFWSGSLASERAAAHGVSESALAEFYAERNLLHRRVRTSDVAAAVAFLLSEESSRTTGCVLPVDGGVASAFPR